MLRNRFSVTRGVVWLIGCSAVLAGLVSGCASKPDKEAWLKDLPVQAQTSLNGIRHQDIRLLKLYETKEVDGQLWMRGKGYADTNDHTSKFFWESPDAPNVEVTIVKPDAETFKQCQILFDQMASKRRQVQLKGEGLFSAKGSEDSGFVGIFRIDVVDGCVLGPSLN